MSRAIYKELTHEMIRRMRNWARWNAGDGDSLGFGNQPMWNNLPRGSRAELPLGIISGEAGDTETAIDSLPIRYAQAIKLFWQYEGQSLAHLSARCCCDYRTYEKRVTEGHVRLGCEISRRTEAERVKNERYKESQIAA